MAMNRIDTVASPNTAGHTLHAIVRLTVAGLIRFQPVVAKPRSLLSLVRDHGWRAVHARHRSAHLGAPRVPHRGITDACPLLNRAGTRCRISPLGAGADPIRPWRSPATPVPRDAYQTAGIADIEVMVSREGAINPLDHLSRALGVLGEVAIPVIAESDVAEGTLRVPTPEEIGGAITRIVTQRVRAPAILEMVILNPPNRGAHGCAEGTVRPIGGDTELAVTRTLVPVTEMHLTKGSSVVITRPPSRTIEALSTKP